MTASLATTGAKNTHEEPESDGRNVKDLSSVRNTDFRKRKRRLKC
jgi:hypothetical protein